MKKYVGRFTLPEAGNRVVFLLPKVPAEGPHVARQRILRGVMKMRVAGVWINGQLTWLAVKDVLRWWEAADMDVVEAGEAGL